MGDFWDDMKSAFIKEASFDEILQEDVAIQGKSLNGPAFKGMQQALASEKGLPIPVEAGTRVRFTASLAAALTYPNIPEPRVAGTVVTVRTGSGDTTYDDGRVFVAWDDGVFRPMAPEHLKPFSSARQAKNVRMLVGDLGDLSSFFASSSSGRADELVHKATKDLWAVKKKGDKFSIERLFKDNGDPIKE